VPTSQNGWSASPNLQLRPLSVGGVAFLPGIRDDDDVATVLAYVLTQFHERVEQLRNPGCWGYSYRENRNDPNSLSNHASGTAVDANAPAHPNGVPTSHTFTPAQIAEVHLILAEVDGAVRWGGDYHGTPDAMHFEINTDAPTLHRVAEKLRGNEPMTPEDLAKIDKMLDEKLTALVPVLVKAVWDASVTKASAAGVAARAALRKAAGV
jgi:hypothetical protein